MRIATFNVNGINGRLPRLLEWLEATRPDVACLQEIKTSGARFPAAALEAAGYHVRFEGQPSHHGVAVLSRGEAARERLRRLPGDDEDRQARYLEVEAHGITVASVYVPNGNPQPGPKFDYKLAWHERLIAHGAQLLASGRPVVLAGDFNVVPTNADIYNWWPWQFDAVLQPQTRDAHRRLLDQGWIDATRQLHPDERIYTFWVNEAAYRRKAGFRMDFLLLSPALLPRLRATGVDHEQRGLDKPSDHAPVWIELAD
ncbi:MAG TPA: exodeoxyribonuclease III [Ramlibacter sp.]|nr:exodeoxyribonuclease III [Ramlibacter sp.]